jgi:hypothetical protein
VAAPTIRPLIVRSDESNGNEAELLSALPDLVNVDRLFFPAISIVCYTAPRSSRDQHITSHR